jgi:hypothetical protein
MTRVPLTGQLSLAVEMKRVRLARITGEDALGQVRLKLDKRLMEMLLNR